MVLQSIFKCSYNRMVDHSGMSQDVVEQHDVERLEQATKIVKKLFLKGSKFASDSL